jgi:glucokinase
VNNDANCFAVGELHFGEGRGFRHLVGVTIGTGLGAGVIINGHLYSGANCGAGEIGTIPYKDATIEDYVSGTRFHRELRVGGHTLRERALEGDARALQAFAEFGADFGHAMMTILYAYDPEAIVLGGSVTKSYALFEGAMREKLKAFAFPHLLDRVRIKVSQEPQIAIFGAAALCLDARS